MEQRDDAGSNFLADDGSSAANVSRVLATDLDDVSNALGSLGYETGPYEGYTHETNNIKGIFKLDWNINNKHILTATYNFLDADSKHISDANIYQADRYERILREAQFNPVKVTSIKEQTAPHFARYLESVAQQSPPDSRERRLKVARHFRREFAQGGDYVKVRATKPERTSA